MKNLNLINMNVAELNSGEAIQINGGGIFYWIGYAMGILAGENQAIATENSEYYAMTNCF